MTSALVDEPQIQQFLDRLSGQDSAAGNTRTKQIVRRVVGDLFALIDELDITDEEFWKALNFLAEAAPELGLWAPGLGIERFLDIRADRADQKAGVGTGTPRTIEGPLYVEGAPLSEGSARLDDGSQEGDVLIMHGRVVDAHGKPIARAIVDVWHANSRGNYSYFDRTQSAYNLRRRIQTGADGTYRFRTILPSGYAVPPGGTTERLLKALGRHGKRPAHIHFFISAPNHRHLTTQINIAGDPLLHDDFAFATRDELIPTITARTEPDTLRKEGLQAPFKEIAFDFVLLESEKGAEVEPSPRRRVAPQA
jgi:catechol 1,2-dioxygenase